MIRQKLIYINKFDQLVNHIVNKTEKRVTITVRGAPNIIIQVIAKAKPQRSFLLSPWSVNTEIKTTMENMERTKKRIAEILNFSFLGANMRKINT